ncbi:MAG: hypothetical protein AAF206_13595 [Bacteroidota bacterium]
MKLLFRPYSLFLMLAATLVMVIYMRINKQSFYHHYFKVIEDVELRNSHALAASEGLAIFSLPQVSERLPEWFKSILGLLVVSSLVMLTLPLIRQKIVQQPITLQLRFAKVYPIRAP